jgi:hypothetical protein
MTAEAVGIYFDYSKHRITDETLRLFLQLTEESGLRARIDAMFRGEKINVTEKRAVLHVALRAPLGQSIVVDGEDAVPQVHAVLDKMAVFSTRVLSGKWQGYTGKPIRTAVNIGIGGSDLGPVTGAKCQLKPQRSLQNRPMVVTQNPANGIHGQRRDGRLLNQGRSKGTSGSSLRLCLRSNSLLENGSRPSVSEPKGSLDACSSKEYQAIIGRREAPFPLAGFWVTAIGRI